MVSGLFRLYLRPRVHRTIISNLVILCDRDYATRSDQEGLIFLCNSLVKLVVVDSNTSLYRVEEN